MDTVAWTDLFKYGLPVFIYIIGLVTSYAKLNAKIGQMQKQINDLQDLRQQVKEINKVLNQIVGKIDLFFGKFCDNNK